MQFAGFVAEVVFLPKLSCCVASNEKMSDFALYLTVAAFPLIGLFVIDWWNAGWASEHHVMVLPPDMALKREQSGRPLQLFKYALLLLVLRLIGGADLWHLVPIRNHSNSWSSLVLFGIIGGTAMITCRRGISLLSRDAADSEKNEYFLRGSSALWFAVFLFGGFVEECWRGFCIVGFQHNGYESPFLLVITSFAFSLAHQTNLPSRIAPGLANAGADMLMGVILGALFIRSGSIVTPYCASVIYYVYSFLIVRPASTPPKPIN
jgi:membrane protease YdiL (CAAX protease family)